MAQYLQNSFTGGEVSEGIMGRTDLDVFFKSAKKIDNFIVRPFGGLATRGGLKKLIDFSSMTEAPRVFPFVYSKSVTFSVVFANTSGSPTKMAILIVSDDGTIYQTITKYDDLTGTEVDLPYTFAQYSELKYAQSGNTLYFCHDADGDNVAVHKLMFDGSDFTFEWVDFTAPDAVINVFTVTSTGTTGSKTYNYSITCYNSKTQQESLPDSTIATTTTGVPLEDMTTANCNQIYFTVLAAFTDDYDSVRLYRDTGTGTKYFISEFLIADAYTPYDAGPPIVLAGYYFNDIGFDANNTLTTPKEFEDFNTDDGNPRTVSFLQNRSFFANIKTDELKLWLSNIQNFENLSYSFPKNDTRGIQYSLAANQKDGIEYLIESGKSMLFTSGGLYRFGATNSGAITASNLSNVYQSNIGCSKIKPVIVGGRVVYVTSSYKEVRDIAYNYASDSLEGFDLSFYVPHLMRDSKMKSLGYQHYPYRVLWFINENKELFGLTYSLDQKIFGWHRHSSQCDFENLIVLPQDNIDVMYCITKFDGIYSLCKLMPDIFETSDIVNTHYLDAYITYDGITPHESTVYSVTAGIVGSTVVFTKTSGEDFVTADLGKRIITQAGKILEITVINSVDSVDCEVIETDDGLIESDTGYEISVNTYDVTYESKDIAVMSVGNYLGEFESSSSGIITLTYFYSKLVMGLKYDSELITNDLNIPKQNITFNYKNITSLDLKMEKSSLFKVGQYENNLVYSYYDIPPALSDDEANIHNIKISTGWSKTCNVSIKREVPLPLNISCIDFNFVGGGK